MRPSAVKAVENYAVQWAVGLFGALLGGSFWVDLLADVLMALVLLGCLFLAFWCIVGHFRGEFDSRRGWRKI